MGMIRKIYTGDILEWDKEEWVGGHRDLVEWDYELLNMRQNDWKEFCIIIGNKNRQSRITENIRRQTENKTDQNKKSRR
jgi:hypothetical protein